MRNPLISVIIPIYKVEMYLERCLISVVESTYENLEIICINDGSPDNCQKILERYAAVDYRFIIINQENQGISAARNAGISVANGEYLLFIDSDDWIHEQAIEMLLFVAEQSHADVTIGDYINVSHESQFHNKEKLLNHEVVGVLTAIEAMNTPGYLRDMVWGILYRTETVSKCRFPLDCNWAEDAFFNIQIISLQCDLKYAKVELPLYAYFQRPDSMVKKITPNVRIESIKYWLDHLREFEIPQYAIFKIIEELFYYRMTGKYCINPEVSKTNARMVIKRCFSYRKYCKKLNKKKVAKLILMTHFPNIYYMIISWKDPSYRTISNILKGRYRKLILQEWNCI